VKVVFLSPNYPPEMRQYTRGLAEVGAQVLGIGDTPVSQLSASVKQHLHDYLHVPAILDEDDVVARAHAWLRGREVDHVLANWEVLVLTAARMRERFGLPGMGVETVDGFRDKQKMKDRVRAAGLRTPRSYRARSVQEVEDAARRIGYPLIIKPIAGAGSADTWRVDDASDLPAVLRAVRHVPEVSCEEFITGEEYTWDTLSVDGVPVYENIAQYLPPPLIARTREEISPVIITVRDLEQAKLQPARTLGRGVLRALGMQSGFTHMEWFRTPSGEAVFGEIGCRPGGAHLVDQMNYTSDVDLFREWARVACWGRIGPVPPRRYNAAIIFKRALGQGRITRIHGLDAFMARYGEHVVEQRLLPIGARRRDWKQTLTSDGHILLRHPDWETTRRMAEEAASEVTLFAERG
jgi:biotin carboxylase